MGWLFACFGCSKKRKRLRSSQRIHFQDTVRRLGSYRPLEPPSSHSPEASEGGYLKPIRSNLKRRKQGKPSIRKKVRFDLNVIAYEPVRAYEDNDNNDGDLRSILAAEWGELEDQEAEEEEDNVHFLVCKGNSTGVERKQPCTFGYRYSNCYDEEDEMGSEEDDDLVEEDELDDEEEETDLDQTREELETAHESLESDTSESRGVNPVLVPIENISQWRAIKMKRSEIFV